MTQYLGQRFGDYRLIDYLGSGGFADVYLGEHVYLHTKENPMNAAIKVLKGKFTPEDILEFRKEAQTVFHFDHSHIVRILAFSVAQLNEYPIPFIVMYHAKGGSLDKKYPLGTKLSLPTIISYLRPIAEALQYAHDKKIVHRDIKPHNILLGEQGKVLLSDFGIAVTSHSTPYMVQQVPLGSAPYMAPEQWDGKAQPASDQYALAVMIYEWLCGTRPFQGSLPELYIQHHFTPPPLLHEKTTIYPSVEEVILKALTKKPEDRYPTVTDFADALEQAWRQSKPPIGTRLLTYRGHIRSMEAVAWSPDSIFIASADTDGKVRVWNASTGIPIFACLVGPNGANTVAWSPDSTHIAITRGSIQVWNVKTKKCIITYEYHDYFSGYAARAVTWSPDGTSIAFGGDDGYLRVCKIDHTQDIVPIRGSGMVVADAATWCVDWSPDGSYIASDANDGTVHIWDATTGEEVYTYRGHSDTVRALAWSPDGTRIASANHEVQVWQAI